MSAGLIDHVGAFTPSPSLGHIRDNMAPFHCVLFSGLAVKLTEALGGVDAKAQDYSPDQLLVALELQKYLARHGLKKKEGQAYGKVGGPHHYTSTTYASPHPCSMESEAASHVWIMVVVIRCQRSYWARCYASPSVFPDW